MRFFHFVAVALCAATFAFANAAVSTLNAEEPKFQQVSDVVYKKGIGRASCRERV